MGHQNLLRMVLLRSQKNLSLISWSSISNQFGVRCSKKCRKREINSFHNKPEILFLSQLYLCQMPAQPAVRSDSIHPGCQSFSSALLPLEKPVEFSLVLNTCCPLSIMIVSQSGLFFRATDGCCSCVENKRSCSVSSSNLSSVHLIF